VHIVFSTKHREPYIIAPYENELHRYLCTVCKDWECPPIQVGGYYDHIHVLCLLSKKLPLMKLVEQLKVGSSKMMKTKHILLSEFTWQRGYGAFSVNPRGVDRVTKYIQNQHVHHRKKTFQDEFRALLKKYNVEYDERYVWD
jgi:putative transposase